MLDKLASIAARVEELNRLLADPAVAGDRRELQRLGRELAELRPLSEVYRDYRTLLRELEENREMARDEKDPRITSYNVCYTKLLRSPAPPVTDDSEGGYRSTGGSGDVCRPEQLS